MNNNIKFLVPDLPNCQQLIPWLEQIDQNKYYSNFGPLVTEFELQISNLLQLNALSEVNLITTHSGTSALEIALQALALPEKSGVLVPSFSYVASATAIVKAGLTPIFCDVDPDTWLLTPELATQALTTHSYAAVVPVATFGVPQNVSEWDKFSEQHNIPVVIDAAGAIGNQQISQHCTIIISLHATKPLGIGEGGLIVSANKDFIAECRSLSNFGFIDKELVRLGTNSKLSEYHAAVGLAALQNWPQRSQQYSELRKNYYQLLNENPNLSLQAESDSIISSLLAVKFDNNNLETIIDNFKKKNIEVRRAYYPPLHQHEFFRNYAVVDNLTVTSQLEQQCLCLPFHLKLTAEDIILINNVINSY